MKFMSTFFAVTTIIISNSNIASPLTSLEEMINDLGERAISQAKASAIELPRLPYDYTQDKSDYVTGYRAIIRDDDLTPAEKQIGINNLQTRIRGRISTNLTSLYSNHSVTNSKNRSCSHGNAPGYKWCDMYCLTPGAHYETVFGEGWYGINADWGKIKEGTRFVNSYVDDFVNFQKLNDVLFIS